MAKINYSKLKERVCLYCNETYKPTGPAQVSCTKCREHLNSIQNQVKGDLLRYKKFNTYYGIGKGYSNVKGKNNSTYKNGIGYFHTVLSKRAKKELRYCQDCGKDLIDANQYEWCAHHIDHDRDNNVWINITLLCKRCHQLEHKCWLALNIKSATTIPKGSTPKQVEAVSIPDSCEECDYQYSCNQLQCQYNDIV